MISGKLFRQVLDKILKSPTVQQARVQVLLPDGKYYDVKSIQVLENKIIGARESHRIAITVQGETWSMGEAIKKLGEFSIR